MRSNDGKVMSYWSWGNGSFSKLSSRKRGLRAIDCWWWSSGSHQSGMLAQDLRVKCHWWIWRNRRRKGICTRCQASELLAFICELQGAILVQAIFHCRNPQNQQKEHRWTDGCHAGESVGRRIKKSDSVPIGEKVDSLMDFGMAQAIQEDEIQEWWDGRSYGQ